MTEFSCFPTCHWSAQKAEQTAVVWEKGNSVLFSALPSQISWRLLQSLLEQTIDLFEKQHINLTETIAYRGKERFAELLTYLATLLQGGRILVLNPALPDVQCRAVLADIGVDSLIEDHHFANFFSNQTACLATKNFRFDLSRPATLTLTSGSSGLPKAVVHSLQAHLANAKGVCQLMQFQAKDCWLLSLPLFHVSGQGIIWRWLQAGAKLCLYQDKADFFSLLAQSSHASLVPTQLQRYLANSCVKKTGQKILLGGAYIPDTLIRQAQKARIETFAGYGMTEAASTICAIQGETDNVGSPLSEREVKIVDGQIYIKGNVLGLGYWHQGKILPFVDAFGWFATKDKGEWQQGKLKVIGRMDNMFISGGENIQPEQIEQCLFGSGLVKQLFILPKNDQEFGQRPVAFVEFIQPFSEQAVEKLANFAKMNLEGFKRPIAYFPLPKEMCSQGIKISRKQLQQFLD